MAHPHRPAGAARQPWLCDAALNPLAPYAGSKQSGTPSFTPPVFACAQDFNDTVLDDLLWLPAPNSEANTWDLFCGDLVELLAWRDRGDSTYLTPSAFPIPALETGALRDDDLYPLRAVNRLRHGEGLRPLHNPRCRLWILNALVDIMPSDYSLGPVAAPTYSWTGFLT
ncbi:hypothetical protein NMY22_g15186 [Coprinellus aureogranulatus]|nr:hypothetical protein NMY22_g15186 [Coprinellus aureogranulatus]